MPAGWLLAPWALSSPTMATTPLLLLLVASGALAAPLQQPQPRLEGHSVPLSKLTSQGVPAALRSNNGGPNGSSFPTGGNVWPVAIYWITIEVGTPPKPFPVAIDSGSMTLDIQGPGCENCPKFKPNNAYKPSASSTSKPCNFLSCQLPRNFSNSYQTCDLANPDAVCTIKGANYEDAVSIGQLGPVPVTFGAITEQTSNFDQFNNVCGVVGLAGRAGKGNVFESLRKGGFIKQDMFGMCLAAGSTSNGTFTVGGLDSRLFKGEFSWAKNVGGGGLYEMPISSISLGGQPVHTTSTAILDSGTNVLLVPTPIFSSFRTAFANLCKAGHKLKGICGGGGGKGKGLLDGGCQVMSAADIEGAASAASFLAAVLAEIYLCNVCSYQERLRRNERGQRFRH
jgi:hypothetical protein